MLLRTLHRTEEAFIRLLLVAMTLLVFVETVMRFGFNTGLLWAQEVTLYIAAWFVLFGASYGIRVGAHIGVDVFVRLLPTLQQRIVAVIAIVLCLVYCGLFLYGGWIYLGKLKMIGLEMEDLPIQKWIPMSVLIIGFVMLVIRLLDLLRKVLKGEANGFSHADEVKESMAMADAVHNASDKNTSHKAGR